MLRHGPAPDAPAPTGDAIDIGSALAALPRGQREAVVLQGLGLGVADIPGEEDELPRSGC